MRSGVVVASLLVVLLVAALPEVAAQTPIEPDVDVTRDPMSVALRVNSEAPEPVTVTCTMSNPWPAHARYEAEVVAEVDVSPAIHVFEMLPGETVSRELEVLATPHMEEGSRRMQLLFRLTHLDLVPVPPGQSGTREVDLIVRVEQYAALEATVSQSVVRWSAVGDATPEVLITNLDDARDEVNLWLWPNEPCDGACVLFSVPVAIELGRGESARVPITVVRDGSALATPAQVAVVLTGESDFSKQLGERVMIEKLVDIRFGSEIGPVWMGSTSLRVTAGLLVVVLAGMLAAGARWHWRGAGWHWRGAGWRRDGPAGRPRGRAAGWPPATSWGRPHVRSAWACAGRWSVVSWRSPSSSRSPACPLGRPRRCSDSVMHSVTSRWPRWHRAIIP